MKFVTLATLFCLTLRAAWADTYPDFLSLQRDPRLREGRDYEISVLNAGAAVTVMAIHGGMIEPNSDILAQQLAQKYSYNLYLFKSLYAGPEGNHPDRLHVTATHFNDPRLTAMSAQSTFCVSFHGQIEQKSLACVGGASMELRKKLAHALRLRRLDRRLEMVIDANEEGEGWKVPHCSVISGVSPQNVVNGCQKGGVQLELSRELRSKLEESVNSVALQDFLIAIHEALNP